MQAFNPFWEYQAKSSIKSLSDYLSQNDIVFIFHYPSNDFYEVKAESKNKIINSYFYLDRFSQNLISERVNKKDYGW